MRVEIVNTGTELLLGKVVNTHAAFFGEELFKLGLRVNRQTTIPDGEPIREVLIERFPHADILLITGGLGPTSDDITREIVSDLIDRPLRLDEAVWEEIRQFFIQRGREAAENNRRQAMVPEGGEVLSNPNGTAPGLYLPAEPGRWPHLFLLPGPPRELRPMWRDLVEPRLRQIVGVTSLPWRNFRIHGIGESAIATVVEDRLAAIDGLEHGYCARPGEVDIRLIGTQAAIDSASAVIRGAFEQDIVTESEDSIEKVLVDWLTRLGQTVATAESCTGGLIAHTLTNVPGSSTVFPRGYVTYANEAKSDLLGVPAELLATHGAVSEPVATAMAEGCLAASGADHAIAVTGIAGPGGGSAEKPVGTVFIALASRRHDLPTIVRHERFAADRLSFKSRTTRAALDLLRRRLAGWI